MNLKKLTDDELMNCTDRAVDCERDATSIVLRHFQEIERRRLFCTHKCESLFQLVMKRWRYTENEATYRISAMRLLTELPEIEEKIASGALTLTHLNMARSHFRNEKKDTLKEITREEKIEVLKKMENKSKRESQEILICLSTIPQPKPRDEIQPLDGDMVLFKFSADKQLEEYVKNLKGLLAHSHPDISLGELFKNLCELGLTEWSRAKEPKFKRGQAKTDQTVDALNPHQQTPSDEKSHWPVRVNQAAVHRVVWQRDKRKCTNCGSTYALQRDHSIPRAKGGDSSIKNLRLLCRKCNQRAAIEEFGMGLMDKYLN